MASITLGEIFDAFNSKQELKMEEIKKYVLKRHGNSWEGYNDKYSFDQTIQKIVESRCPQKKGYSGSLVFTSSRRAYYRLDKTSKEFSDYKR